MLLSFLLYLLQLFMFNLLTWNVRGIISSTLPVCAMLDKSKCDVAIISEHKLNKFSANYFDSIHSEYFSVVKIQCNSSSEHYVHPTRGRGGVALLLKKSLRFSVKQIEGIQTDCIVGVEISLHCNTPVFVFGVYLPYDNDITNYKSVIDIMYSLYSYHSHYGTVIFAGDFNASVLR